MIINLETIKLYYFTTILVFNLKLTKTIILLNLASRKNIYMYNIN